METTETKVIVYSLKFLLFIEKGKKISNKLKKLIRIKLQNENRVNAILTQYKVNLILSLIFKNVEQNSAKKNFVRPKIKFKGIFFLNFIMICTCSQDTAFQPNTN